MCSHVSASGVWLQVLDAETQADQDDEAEEYIEADEEQEEEEEEDVELEREMEYEDEDDEVSQQASQMQNDNTCGPWELTSVQRILIGVLLGFCQPPPKRAQECSIVEHAIGIRDNCKGMLTAPLPTSSDVIRLFSSTCGRVSTSLHLIQSTQTVCTPSYYLQASAVP